MPRFKVVVQVYHEMEFEAVDVDNAMALATEESKKRGFERFNVNPPKNLDKPAKPKPQKPAKKTG